MAETVWQRFDRLLKPMASGEPHNKLLHEIGVKHLHLNGQGASLSVTL